MESRRWHLLWLVHTQTTLTDAAKAVDLTYDYAGGSLAPLDDDGVWSRAKVAQVIAEVTGVPKVWPQREWDYLKRLEQTLQVLEIVLEKGIRRLRRPLKNFWSAKLNLSSNISKRSSKPGGLM